MPTTEDLIPHMELAYSKGKIIAIVPTLIYDSSNKQIKTMGYHIFYKEKKK